MGTYYETRRTTYLINRTGFLNILHLCLTSHPYTLLVQVNKNVYVFHLMLVGLLDLLT